MDDARKTKPFGLLIGQPITEANLFHLAPMTCLKFRGMDFRDEDFRNRVTEGALATYVANSDPDGIDHGLESKPLLAFAVCYVTAHYVLDLIDEQEAESILTATRIWTEIAGPELHLLDSSYNGESVRSILGSTTETEAV